MTDDVSMAIRLVRRGTRVALFGAAFGTLLVAAPRASTSAPVRVRSAADSIPARLSDEAFWQFVNDMSEPGGSFRSDNFLSNEAGFQYVIPELLRTTKPGGVYLGVGPEQNFTYIAALRPKMAVIFDIRRGNLHAQLMYKALFELSADRAEFVSRLFSKPRPGGLDTTLTADSIFSAYWTIATDTALYRRNFADVTNLLTTRHGWALSAEDINGIRYVYDAFYYGGPAIDYSFPNSSGGRGRSPNYADLMVQNDGLGVQRSYLATEVNFRVLKDLEERNLVIPVVGDFAGPKAIRAVGTYLKERGATVVAFYASNVEQYLFQGYDSWRRYYESVATLPLDSTSTFIRSIGGNAGFRSSSSGPFGRLPSVLCSMQGLLSAFKDGRITTYYDVIAMSR